MKIYTESIPLQSSKTREAVNIHSRVKAAVEKSGFREGVCVIAALSSDCALALLQPDADLLGEFDSWLNGLGSDPHIESGALGVNLPVRIPSLLLGQQLTIPLSDGRLDFGPGEAIFFIELNGVRPRRLTVKILGE